MNFKKELVKTGLGVLYVVVVIFIIRFFSLGFWGIFGFLMFNRLIFMAWKRNFTIKGILKSGGMLLIILYLFKFLNRFGATGYILGIVFICLLILSTRWKKYIEVKQHIESMLWGKPLHKFREEGKKPPNPFF